jgi:hypothetical protein
VEGKESWLYFDGKLQQRLKVIRRSARIWQINQTEQIVLAFLVYFPSKKNVK